jgi:hypothetical protein
MTVVNQAIEPPTSQVTRSTDSYKAFLHDRLEPGEQFAIWIVVLNGYAIAGEQKYSRLGGGYFSQEYLKGSHRLERYCQAKD